MLAYLEADDGWPYPVLLRGCLAAAHLSGTSMSAAALIHCVLRADPFAETAAGI